MRAGTENVPGIIGLGKALDLAIENLEDYSTKIQEIKDYCISQLKENIPGIKFNGRSSDAEASLYTLVSALLPYKNPMIGLELDMKGIAVSQGSACSSGASKPSMVMMFLLSDDEMQNRTPLRISFSHYTTKEDIDYFVDGLKAVSEKYLIENTNQ